MPVDVEDEWQSTRLTKLSRGLRLIGACLYLSFVVAVILFADPNLSTTPLGLSVLGTLVAVAAYDVHFIFRRGVRWNEKGIQQIGTLLPSRFQNWNELSSVLPNMHKRATILTFRRRGHVKVYWGFERHREIFDYATERLEHARTS